MNRLPVGCSTCAHKTVPTECAPCSECALSRPGGSAQIYWEGDAGYISQVKIKRLSAYARIPFHATHGAAGYDLYAASVWYDRSEQILKIGSGLAFEIPSGYVGLLFPRSSIYRTGLHMAFSVGVIDSDYRGEVCGYFHFSGAEGCPYEVGDRFAQLTILPIQNVRFEWAPQLSETERGARGYGHTGRR